VRLEGWHIIVILGFLLVVAVIVGAVLLASAARRGTRPHSGQQPPGAPLSGARPDTLHPPRTKEDRLREIDDLHRRGVVSEHEHRETRKRILDD
jgi:hypothetical protein